MLDNLLGDGISFWVLLVVGILGICIDGGLILASLVEEVEGEGSEVTILIALSANKPVVALLVLASYCDVAGGLCLKIT